MFEIVPEFQCGFEHVEGAFEVCVEVLLWSEGTTGLECRSQVEDRFPSLGSAPHVLEQTQIARDDLRSHSGHLRRLRVALPDEPANLVSPLEEMTRHIRTHAPGDTRDQDSHFRLRWLGGRLATDGAGANLGHKASKGGSGRLETPGCPVWETGPHGYGGRFTVVVSAAATIRTCPRFRPASGRRSATRPWCRS